jgi:hypothetical protein
MPSPVAWETVVLLQKFSVALRACFKLSTQQQYLPHGQSSMKINHYPPAWLIQVISTPRQLIKHFLQEVTLQALEVPRVLAPCQNGLQCYERYTQPPLANRAAWQALVH